MLQWGIIGAGNVAGRFAASLRHEPESRLAAISCRNYEKGSASFQNFRLTGFIQATKNFCVTGGLTLFISRFRTDFAFQRRLIRSYGFIVKYRACQSHKLTLAAHGQFRSLVYQTGGRFCHFCESTLGESRAPASTVQSWRASAGSSSPWLPPFSLPAGSAFAYLQRPCWLSR